MPRLKLLSHTHIRDGPKLIFFQGKKNPLKNEVTLIHYDQVLIYNHYRTLLTALGERMLNNYQKDPGSSRRGAVVNESD